jgi:hypothetical protein
MLIERYEDSLNYNLRRKNSISGIDWKFLEVIRKRVE